MPCRTTSEEGLDAGFFRYLTKPINVDEFMDTLDNALRFSATTAAAADTGVER